MRQSKYPHLNSTKKGERLLNAVEREQIDQIQYLLQEPDVAQFLHQRNKNGDTALHLSVTCMRDDYVALLLAAGADVDRPDSLGYTALMRAGRSTLQLDEFPEKLTQILACVDLLLQAGADPTRRHHDGGSAQYIAKLHGGKSEVTERLAEAEWWWQKQEGLGLAMKLGRALKEGQTLREQGALGEWTERAGQADPAARSKSK